MAKFICDETGMCDYHAGSCRIAGGCFDMDLGCPFKRTGVMVDGKMQPMNWSDRPKAMLRKQSELALIDAHNGVDARHDKETK